MKYEDKQKEGDQFLLKIGTLISTNSYSIPSHIDILKGLDDEARCFVVRYLFASFYTHKSNVSREIFKGQSVQNIIIFVDYLISINYFNDGTRNIDFNLDYIIAAVPPELQKDLLLYYFNSDSPISFAAGTILAKSNEGVNALIAIIYDDSNKKFHLKATLAICENLVPDVANKYELNEYYAVNQESTSQVPATLKRLISFPDSDISYFATKTLYHSSFLSLDDIEKVLTSSEERKVFLGLTSFERYRIDVKSSEFLFPIVVELLEDKSIKISETANNALRYFSNSFPDLVAENIIGLIVLRSTNRPQEFFNVSVTASALKETFKFNPRLQGQILHKLKDLAFNNGGNTRSRAVFTGIALNKREFLALVNEMSESDPKTTSTITGIISGNQKNTQIVSEISETDPSDIQKNAANQIGLLTSYYESGLAQARNSFNWAIGIAVLCILLFFAVIFFFGQNDNNTIILVSGIATGITELLAGTLLLIYKQSLSQLNNYNQQMSRIQNYLLANSFIESLNESVKDNARLELIKSVATNQTNFEITRLEPKSA